MNPDSSSRDSPDGQRDFELLKNFRPAQSVAMLLSACLFLLVGTRLNELRPLFGGTGVGLLIVSASIAGAFIAGGSVLIHTLTTRRRTRAPAQRPGRKPPVVVMVLSAVVALDVVGIVAAAIR